MLFWHPGLWKRMFSLQWLHLEGNCHLLLGLLSFVTVLRLLRTALISLVALSEDHVGSKLQPHYCCI